MKADGTETIVAATSAARRCLRCTTRRTDARAAATRRIPVAVTRCSRRSSMRSSRRVWRETIDAACFVAGPVADGRVQTTNLPWLLDERALARRGSARPASSR
ncbi:MAG: glucokinase [Candidatus Binatia bacterium]